MKTLSPEEAKKILPVTQGRHSWLAAELKQLPVGGAVIIEYNEWKTKTPPYRIANRVTKTYGWKFQNGKMPDGTGWIIKRIE